MRQELISVQSKGNVTYFQELRSAMEDGGRIVTSFEVGGTTWVVVEFNEEGPPKIWANRVEGNAKYPENRPESEWRHKQCERQR